MAEKQVMFRIIKHIGVIKEDTTGWKLELNIVSWNEGYAKYDIRRWNSDHTAMTRGITFTEEEASQLSKLLTYHFDQKHDSFAFNIGK